MRLACLVSGWRSWYDDGATCHDLFLLLFSERTRVAFFELKLCFHHGCWVLPKFDNGHFWYRKRHRDLFLAPRRKASTSNAIDCVLNTAVIEPSWRWDASLVLPTVY